jgi:hypothetical protein
MDVLTGPWAVESAFYLVNGLVKSVILLILSFLRIYYQGWIK